MFNYVGMPVLVDDAEAVQKDGKRYYPTPEGNFYPSVTTVTGVRTDMSKWRARVGEDVANAISKRATTRGTKFHAIVESYLKNDLDETVEGLPKYLFGAARKTLDRISDIHCIEQYLYSDYLRLAGRVDCVASFDNTLSIIDFKTSTKLKKLEWIQNYFVQCAAYAIMYYERTGVKVDKLTVLIACESDMIMQVFETYDISYYVKLLHEYISEWRALNEKY